MCGDGGGGDGQGPIGAGEDPGGEFGGSGGNVGMGNPGGGGGSTGRGDQGQQGAVGAPGSAMGPGAIGGMGAAPGDTSGVGFDLNTIDMGVPPSDSTTIGVTPQESFDAMVSEDDSGAFGFTPMQGLSMGMLSGNLPLGLVGLMMGFAEEGGNVSDYGGGDPDAGGGPSDPYPNLPLNPKPPGWGEDGGGAFFSPGSSDGGGGGFTPLTVGAQPLKFSGDSGLSQYKTRKLLEDKDALGEDYTTEFKKFTKSLF